MVFFNKDERVWVPHATEGYAQGHVVSQDASGVLVRLDSGEEVRAAEARVCVVSADASREFADMILINDLSEPVLLANLRRRYEADRIYTMIGPVLVSMNPYKKLPIYTQPVMRSFAAYRLGDPRVAQNPHIFALANNAYQALLQHRCSQSIVISGESGAGKTEATKFVLAYLTFVSDPKATRQIEQQIVESSPVLEAFGNAKTTRNNNSSRFGKFTRISFDAAGRIAGAQIVSYLLEKPRVAQQAPRERNYHVFYQLCAGASGDERRQLSLLPAEQYHYLNQGRCIAIDGVDDAAEFSRLRAAMHVLGIGPAEQLHVFRVLAGVLTLGNVAFAAGPPQQGKETWKVRDRAVLQTAAQLLGTEESFLEDAIVKRSFQASASRKSHYSIPLNLKQCEDSRDALAKHLYGLLFDWLVDKVNSLLRPQQNQPSQSAAAGELFIGVLDIFGFECFEHNSFEQLLINLANEKILQLFNATMFRTEQAEYANEAIRFEKVAFKDNQELLDMVEKKPVGILSLLDEECVMPNGSDKALLDKIVQQHEKKAPFYRKRQSPQLFGIKHYAGDVDYDSVGLIDKNKDTLHADLEGLMRDSENQFVADLFLRRQQLQQQQQQSPDLGGTMHRGVTRNGESPGSGLVTSTSTSSTMKRSGTLLAAAGAGTMARRETGPQQPTTGTTTRASKASVSAQFREQLASLTALLGSTAVHFIWCLKPNVQQKSDSLDCAYVLTQMRCTGITETIKIRKQGYGYRRPFVDLLHRYRLLLQPQLLSRATTMPRDTCNEFLSKVAGSREQREYWQLGKSKVFLKDRLVFDLEALREQHLGAVVAKIVHFFRGVVARRAYIRWRDQERERRRREEEERRRREEEARRRREEEERRRREEEERRRREEEERRRREEEERRARLEEERQRREEEDRYRREEAERRARLEDERRRREEDERQQREDAERRREEAIELRRRREEEEERRQRDEETRRRDEAVELQRRRREQEDERARQRDEEARRFEDERRRLEALREAGEAARAEERRRIEAERKRIEDERRRLEDERRRREEEKARTLPRPTALPPPDEPPLPGRTAASTWTARPAAASPPNASLADWEREKTAREAARREREAEIQRKKDELERRKQELARRREQEEKRRQELEELARTRVDSLGPPPPGMAEPPPPPDALAIAVVTPTLVEAQSAQRVQPASVSPRPGPALPAPPLLASGSAANLALTLPLPLASGGGSGLTSPPGSQIGGGSRAYANTGGTVMHPIPPLSPGASGSSSNLANGSSTRSNTNLALPSSPPTGMTSPSSTPRTPHGTGGRANPYEEKTADWFRFQTLEELIKTERDYINDVTLMIDVWASPMQQQGIVKPEEQAQIFANITTLLPLNQKFLQDLEKSPWPYDRLMVGEIFLHYVEFFRMYKTFCVNRPMFIAMYEHLRKVSTQFRSFLEQTSRDPRCKGLALPDYHIKPLQRVMKYPLLLKAIIQHTSREHPDYVSLVTAEMKIQDVVTSLNESQKAADENSRIIFLQDAIEDVGELVTPTRRLLHEGEFEVRGSVDEKPSTRTVFMFNDLLVLCTTSKSKFKGGRKFQCRAKIPLHEARIVFVAEDTLKHTFTVEHGLKKYLLTAPSADVKRDWYQDLYQLKRQEQLRNLQPKGAPSLLGGSVGSLKKVPTAPALQHK